MKRFVLLIIALITYCFAAPTLADGKYMPNLKAIGRDPAMPSQAAVIGHHDGKETLIIESGVESDGAPLAWVVPVPAEPELIAAASPGTVATALEIVAPRVFDENKARRDITSAAFLLVAAIVVGVLFRIAIAKRVGSLMAVVLLMMCVVAMLLLPALSTARGIAPSSGVSVVRSVSAGRHDVDVVRATTADDLVRWLNEREFALPEQARPAIEAYIAEGWLFCAARVQLAKGLVAPHPLKLVFPSEKIVYPMRLTAVGGQDLDLDLVVFADAPVSHPRLQTWVASLANPVLPGDPAEFWRYGSRGRVGHPELMPLALDAPWMTRLHGRLDLARERDDLTLTVGEARAVSTKLATKRDAGLVIAQAFIWTVALLMVAVLPFAGHGPTKPHLRQVAGLFAIVSVGIGSAIAVAELRALTLANFQQIEGPHPAQLSGLAYLGVETSGGTASPATVRAELTRRLSWVDDQGRELTREGQELPYGWQVETDAEGKIVVTVVEPSGRPLSMVMGEGVWRPAVVRERLPGSRTPIAAP